MTGLHDAILVGDPIVGMAHVAVCHAHTCIHTCRCTHIHRDKLTHTHAHMQTHAHIYMVTC